MAFHVALVVKNLPANARDTGDARSIPGLGRSPGEGNGNPLEYSCLENPINGGAWWATVRGMQELDMSEQLTHTVIHSGLPWWLSGRESICNAGDMGSIPGPGDPWRKKWQPTPVFLPGKSHGQRSMEGYSP